MAKEGEVVLQEVVQMTGLPEDYLDSEISTLLGVEDGVKTLTLDELRSVLLTYLENVNEEMLAQEQQ